MSLASFQEIKKNSYAISATQSSIFSALSASGDRINFRFQASVHFKIGHLSWTFTFQVAEQLPVPIILGSDFLTKTKAIINMASHTLTFPYGTPRVFTLLSQTHQHEDMPIAMGENLTAEQKEQVTQLIAEYPETITKNLGRTNILEYHIRVNSSKIIRNKPYQYAPPKLALMRQHIDDLLKKGVIRPSTSPFASAAFLVPKKGGKTRMVVDYRNLNQILELDATPMPTIESAFQHLGQARWFTLLDLNSAYNQIPLSEQSKPYTSFVVPWAQFEFNYLPFGLASGSMVLTSLIDRIFGDIKFKYVYNFFDDLCIYSDGSFDDHLIKVRSAIERLRDAGLTVNPEKITVASNHIQFLGHIFANHSISIHPDRTQPIDNFPVPKNIKQLSRFLGMTAFYARFIKDYAIISQPLNQLKRKGVEFIFGPAQQKAFETLKAALVSSPILRMPDFSKEFIVHTDASGTGIGSTLFQEHDGQVFPVCYSSRALNQHELNYSTLQLECLAIVFALQKYQQYLEHREFQLHTDCSALTWLLNHPRQVGKIARWISFINSFKFQIHHIKGKDNVLADCLSRLFENTDPTEAPKESPPPVMSLFGIPEIFKDIATHQHEDPELSKIIRNPRKPPNYTVVNGVLMHRLPNQNKPRVVIPVKLFDMLFRYYHESPSAAHLGIRKTLARIEPFFWAKDLKQIITDRVRSCVQCQRCKQAPNTNVGHLASELVCKPWEKIFVDHIGPLPRSSKGNKYILTIVDAFSKFVIMLPARNTQASTSISLLTKHVFSIFGPPKYLVSDNVSNFRSKVFQELCLGLGIQHIYTSPYYPNPSHAERVNKQIKIAIRIFHNKYQQFWDQNLHWFQMAFNSAVHESTQNSPSRLFLGRTLYHPLELQWNLDKLVDSQGTTPSTQDDWSRAIESLRRARESRERKYNQKRTPNTFKSGDWVMFRLNPISKAVDHINQKLLPMWSKPCVIETFTSPVTVRLIDPVNSKFIRKAHVSQLKRFFQPTT